jgi:hypothetical protein
MGCSQLVKKTAAIKTENNTKDYIYRGARPWLKGVDKQTALIAELFQTTWLGRVLPTTLSGYCKIVYCPSSVFFIGMDSVGGGCMVKYKI